MKAFRDIDIQELLPQQPPFRFVDHLEDYQDQEAVISFTPGPGNLLMENGVLCAEGLLEHMAQANAAREGYRCLYVLHIPVSIGVIGQVRQYQIYRLPREGERLDTRVFLRYEMFKVCLCDVEVRCGDELLATATLKTAILDE